VKASPQVSSPLLRVPPLFSGNFSDRFAFGFSGLAYSDYFKPPPPTGTQILFTRGWCWTEPDGQRLRHSQVGVRLLLVITLFLPTKSSLTHPPPRLFILLIPGGRLSFFSDRRCFVSAFLPPPLLRVTVHIQPNIFFAVENSVLQQATCCFLAKIVCLRFLNPFFFRPRFGVALFDSFDLVGLSHGRDGIWFDFLPPA